MAYGRYRMRGRYANRDFGREAALRHIEQARDFSREIGGTDVDVKEYFFGLSKHELDRIFSEYGVANGKQAEEYARRSYSKWKSGSTQMSGLVAQRLFRLLPPRMPIAKKLELAGSLWNHFGPRSSHYFVVGPRADVGTVIAAIQEKLDSAIINYVIPAQIRTRFEWLSTGDVTVKEQLLNHFRQLERKLAIATLQEQMPILQTQLREYSNQTIAINTRIEVQRHTIDIWIEEQLGEKFREGRPQPRNAGLSRLAWWIISIIVVVVSLLVLTARH